MQAELARGHPELSAYVYLWETGHCNDLPLISGKVATILPLKMGLKTQFLSHLKKYIIFLSVST